jgi:hypothetical protein
MSTVRLLPLATPIAAGVAVTAGGAATVLTVLGLLVILFLARAVRHRRGDADLTDPRTTS